MESKAKIQWCHGGEVAYGPFDSPEAAIADARDLHDEQDPLIGHCKPIIPANYIVADIDVILENMDEQLSGEGCYLDEHCFEPKPGAQEALQELLDNWANEYVEANKDWYMAGAVRASKLQGQSSE